MRRRILFGTLIISHVCLSPMTQPSSRTDDLDPISRRWWTVPNALTLFRGIGSILLVYLGWRQFPQAFLVWYLVLAITDFIDGRIAVYFHQRTVLGARLDSFADALLYAAVLVGALFLWHDRLLPLWPWIAMACGSYAIATLYGMFKFGRWPSYHNWTAKGSWVFVVAAIVCLAWNWTNIPLLLATVSVTLANIESIAITHRLKQWRSDVNSFFKIESGGISSR